MQINSATASPNNKASFQSIYKVTSILYPIQICGSFDFPFEPITTSHQFPHSMRELTKTFDMCSFYMGMRIITFSPPNTQEEDRCRSWPWGFLRKAHATAICWQNARWPSRGRCEAKAPGLALCSVSWPELARAMEDWLDLKELCSAWKQLTVGVDSDKARAVETLSGCLVAQGPVGLRGINAGSWLSPFPRSVT